MISSKTQNSHLQLFSITYRKEKCFEVRKIAKQFGEQLHFCKATTSPIIEDKKNYYDIH